MLTNIEVFSKVKKHLLSQNEKCISNNVCALKNEKGLSCAIGCLIPDKLYTPDLEDFYISIDGAYDRGSANKLVKILELINIPNTNLVRVMLKKLQEIHDEYEVDQWPKQLDLLEADIVSNEI